MPGGGPSMYTATDSPVAASGAMEADALTQAKSAYAACLRNVYSAAQLEPEPFTLQDANGKGVPLDSLNKLAEKLQQPDCSEAEIIQICEVIGPICDLIIDHHITDEITQSALKTALNNAEDNLEDALDPPEASSSIAAMDTCS